MLRTSLASISGNRRKGPDLDPSERGFLLGLSAGGATPSKIFTNIASQNLLRDQPLPLPPNESIKSHNLEPAVQIYYQYVIIDI